jgi:hypothetical protein
MVNVLDILETTDSISPAPKKKVIETAKAETEVDTKQMKGKAATIEAGSKSSEIKAAIAHASTEAGPSEATEKRALEIEEKSAEEATEKVSPEKVATPAPEALKESIEYIIRHASGKRLSKEEEREAQYYAQKLKYSKGALVFNGSGEEDFLYCLPDNKEISVSREIGRSFGFPKLEDGLSVLSKDELADSLAYNSIKV